MSHSPCLEEEILFEQNVSSEQNFQNNREVTIIAPFLPFHNEEILQKSASQKNQESFIVQRVTTGQNQVKEETQIHQKIRSRGKNLLTLQKKYRQLSSINPSINSNIKRNDTNLTPSDQQHSRQSKFDAILHQKQFMRSNMRSNRRSLNVIMRQNEDNIIDTTKNNNQGGLIARGNKKVASQQHTQRRYREEDDNGSYRGSDIELFRETNQKDQKLTIRKALATSMNNATTAFGKSHSLSKRHHWQSFSRFDEEIYNHPQKNQQRVVVFIKTYIISPFQSVSIQVSLLKRSLIIVANLIGEEKQTIKLILNQQKTQKLYNESFNDWEILGKRISVEMTSSGGKRIKISPIRQMVDFMRMTESNNETHNLASIQTAYNVKSWINKRREDRKKQAFLRQKQFIRRNYYTISTKGTKSNYHGNSNCIFNNETIPTVHENSGSNNQNSSKRKFSLIQQNHIEIKSPSVQEKTNNNHRKTQYFVNTKHIDYLSPQIKQKVKQIKKDKHLDTDEFLKQQLKKQAFLKKQQLFIERISKSKDRKDSSLNKYVQTSKENNKNKNKPFIVLKVGSVNSIGHNVLLQNRRQIQIKSKDQLKIENHENQSLNCQVIQKIETNNQLLETTNFQYNNQNLQRQFIHQTQKQQFKIKRIESSDQLFDQKQNYNDAQKNQYQNLELFSKAKMVHKNNNLQFSFVQKVEFDKKISVSSEEEYKFESSKGQTSEEYGNQFQVQNESQAGKECQLSKKNELMNLSKNNQKISNKILGQQKGKQSGSQYSAFIVDVDDEYENFEQNFQQAQNRSQFLRKSGNLKECERNSQQYQQSFENDFEQYCNEDVKVVEEKYSSQFQEDNINEVAIQQQEEDYLDEQFLDQQQVDDKE